MVRRARRRPSQPAPRRGRWLGIVLLALALTPAVTFALDIRLWPLIDYHRDTTAGETTLGLFGPLVRYESSPDRSLLAVRPLFYWKRAPGSQGNVFSMLYPLTIARWGETRGSTRILGLFSIDRQGPREPDAPSWERRITLFPFVFYRFSETDGASLAVLPFYADLRQFLGYARVRMVLFPAYLKLEEPLIERTWLPFPFVGWTGGATGRGWRAWPFYGWQEEGNDKSFRYLLWPFYVRQELHRTQPEREERVSFTPFYSRIDSPTIRSRGYGTILYTHTLDRKARTETWGFPWPLWVYQRQADTRQRISLRLLPFYEDRHQGNQHARFYLWPLYRTRTVDADDYFYTRRDFLLTLGRESDEQQFSHRHRRTRSTFFPLWRRTTDDGDASFNTPALFDALLPGNESLRTLYAPLWTIYRSDIRQDRTATWSLLWDLISFDGTHVRSPIAMNPSQPPS